MANPGIEIIFEQLQIFPIVGYYPSELPVVPSYIFESTNKLDIRFILRHLEDEDFPRNCYHNLITWSNTSCRFQR